MGDEPLDNGGPIDKNEAASEQVEEKPAEAEEVDCTQAEIPVVTPEPEPAPRKGRRYPRTEKQKASFAKAAAKRRANIDKKKSADSAPIPAQTPAKEQQKTPAELASILSPFIELTHYQNEQIRKLSRGKRRRKAYSSSDSEAEESVSAPVKKKAASARRQPPPIPADLVPIQQPIRQAPATPAKPARPPPPTPEQIRRRQLAKYMSSLGF